MRIRCLREGDEAHSIAIRGILGTSEWAQLKGKLGELCVFAAANITEPATFTKTGAHHSHAKYLLLPVKLRRQFKTDEYDYEQLRCGAIHYRDQLYIIYSIPARKGVHPPTEQDPDESLYSGEMR